MNRDHDFTGQLEAYLDEFEGVTPLPDAIHDEVLARLPTTKQIARRLPMTNRSVGLALAAAAVLVAALIGFQALHGLDMGRPGTVETQSPRPSAVQPTGSPAPLSPPRDVAVHDGPLAPGNYTYFDVEPGSTFNVAFTVPAGWTWNGRYLSKGGAGLPNGAAIFFFAGPVDVYPDPCRWAGAHSTPMTDLSVRSLMTALAVQPLRAATTPIARPANSLGVADGWQGMSIGLTVPVSVDLAGCDKGQYRSWGPDDRARSHEGAAQRDLVWGVDLTGNGVDQGGQLLIVDASSFPATPADTTREIQAILRSIQTGHWG